MNNLAAMLLISLSLLAGTALASSEPIDKIEAYGIYVAAKNGYIKIAPYSHDYRIIEFQYLNDIPIVERDNEKLTLVAYAKDFSQNSIELELRPIEIKIKLEKINFSVKPLDKPDMYELTIDSPIKDGAILQVRAWGIYENFGAVVLGNTQEELVKYFSKKELSNAISVTQYLDDALVAYPGNAKLQELSPHWKAAAAEEKDKNDYAYVEEKWQRYEAAEKLTVKKRFLDSVVSQISGYLNQHPNGAKADEAKERQAIAEEKLKEYKKLL